MIMKMILNIFPLTGGCALLAVIIYGSKLDSYLHWSFGLAIVGALFHGAGALLLTIGMLQRS